MRTSATARRYRDHVVPGRTLVDEAALGRIFAGWTVDVGLGGFSAPTLIAAGRRDSIVGYTDATALLEYYLHATLAVIEDAGHALMHERSDLLATLLGDGLARARSMGQVTVWPRTSGRGHQPNRKRTTSQVTASAGG